MNRILVGIIMGAILQLSVLAQTPPATPAGATSEGAKKSPAPGKKAGAETKPQSASKSEPAEKTAILTGDFRAVTDDATPICSKLHDCVRIVGTDQQTEVGDVTALYLTAEKASLSYLPKANATEPAFIVLGKTYPKEIYPWMLVTPPSKENAPQHFEQMLGNDFCRKDENCNCTTEILKPSSNLGTKAECEKQPELLHWETNWKGKVAAYVQSADDAEPHPATINAFGPDSIDIDFFAPKDFKPATLGLRSGTNASYSFPYTLLQPVQTVNLNYAAEDLGTVCDQILDPDAAGPAMDGQPAKTKPDCEHTSLQDFAAQPLSSGSKVKIVAVQDKLMVAQVTAPAGLEPWAIFVTNSCTNRKLRLASTEPCHKKTVIVRRTTKPGLNNNLLRVDLSIMDQITMDRNFGRRMSKRYLAVTLDVKNPTAKKLQFKKSAIYFDVDYVESKEREEGFFQRLAVPASVGLYKPSVYQPPFDKYKRPGEDQPRYARFGIEQNVKQAPLNYLSALGSFDYTTELTDKQLKSIELFGSLLTTISTGGVVATSSTAFRDGAAIFAGTFLPGLRSIVLNTPEINRKRTNLVGQTLQEVIEIPAGSTASTIVVLPRTGILAFTDGQIPVVIDRVLDVHLEPEVVTELNETPVLKNSCKVGYTKEQAREALGEPTGLTTNADQTSTFTFTKGSVVSADFDAKGFLVACKTRSMAEQLNQTTTLVEATQVLTDAGLSMKKINLTDGGVILTDIAGVSTIYRFDAKGNKQPDYTLLYDGINGEKGKTKAEFDKFLQDKASALSSARSEQIKSEAGKKGQAFDTDIRYSSPDLQDAWLLVRFKKAKSEKSIDDTSLVDKITFEGNNPGSVK